MSNYGRSTRGANLPRLSEDPFEKGMKRHLIGMAIMAIFGAVAVAALVVGGFMSFQAQTWDALVTSAAVAGGCIVLTILTFAVMAVNFLKMK